MVGPLTGFVVGVTGHRRWQEQAHMLARRGAQVVHGPVMHTNVLHDTDATLAATTAVIERRPDFVLLTTGVGTRSWFTAAESACLDSALRAVCRDATVLARGPKARSAAVGAGLDVHWQAAGETSDELVDRLAELDVRGATVAVQRDGGAPLLADRVRALGADVIDVGVYRWELPIDDKPARRLLDLAVDGSIDAVTFTSAYAVENAFALATDADRLQEALNREALAVAVGPVTAHALHVRGVTRVIEPNRARLGAMVHALVDALRTTHRLLRFEDVEARWQGNVLIGPNDAVTVLSPRERHVLAALVERAPSVVPKTDLLAGSSDTHAVEAAVARLRAKLGPLHRGIRAIPRRGYASMLEVVDPPVISSPR